MRVVVLVAHVAVDRVLAGVDRGSNRTFMLLGLRLSGRLFAWLRLLNYERLRFGVCELPRARLRLARYEFASRRLRCSCGGLNGRRRWQRSDRCCRRLGVRANAERECRRGFVCVRESNEREICAVKRFRNLKAFGAVRIGGGDFLEI